MPQIDTRYSTVAILLHWAIAALIMLNIAVGFVIART
jgi:cytochrome b561